MIQKWNSTFTKSNKVKLFPKLVLTTLGLMFFQAALTGLLVSRTIRQNNINDARVELNETAEFITNNYNSWKRHIWKQMSHLKINFDNDSNVPFNKENLGSFLASTSVDYLVQKTPNEVIQINRTGSPPTSPTLPVDEIRILFNHPYIQLWEFKNTLYMVGILSLEQENRSQSLYLIKEINNSFLDNLNFNQDVEILIHSSETQIAGAIGNLKLQDLFSDKKLTSHAYLEDYDLPSQGESINIATSKVGTLRVNEVPEHIYLTVALSNSPFQQRIQAIERTVLTVSLISMLITAILSLLLSRSISRPVAQLVEAMRQIRKGTLDIQLNPPGSGELGILINGFNSMADQLNIDQLKIAKSLDEITFLNDFNEEVISSIRDAIAVINENLIIEKANPAFRNLFLRSTENINPALNEISETTFDQTVIGHIEDVLEDFKEPWVQRVRGNNNAIYELKVYPIHKAEHIQFGQKMCVLLVEDISAKIAYEEKILQAEKLSTMTILSAGVAHEINNPLASILTNIQNLIYEEENGEKKEMLHLIEDESRRIAQIVRDLLDFTSRDQEIRTEVSATKTAEEVCRFISHSKREDGTAIPPIHVHCSLEKDMVSIPRDELKQIYINLIQNAIHATEDNEPIKIEVSAKENMVKITISDKGHGIEQDKLNRVFDPFFTTKSQREGTGLGLSVVYGIIMKYNGTIEIESKKNLGTDIIFSLPAGKKEVLHECTNR